MVKTGSGTLRPLLFFKLQTALAVAADRCGLIAAAIAGMLIMW
jgi:hypothetical protein